MKKFKRIIAAAIAAVCSCALTLTPPGSMANSHAVTVTCDEYDGSNANAQSYIVWAKPVNSYLTKSPSGGLMRVQANAVSGKILVEYYDSGYNILSSKTVSAELPIFGGFYESNSNYYILSGQTNYNESDSVEVYRITKYDKNWKKISSCGLYGANTYIPFDAGSARMTDDGKYLLIRTCHEMYTSAASDGQHHQANVTIEVDMDAMQIIDSHTTVSYSSAGYVSHSFNQFIKLDGDHIVAVDHGDAFPRSVVLTVSKADYRTDKFSGNSEQIDMLAFPGRTGDNFTGASVGGFEVSDTAYIVAGNYTGDENNSSELAGRNIFLSVLKKGSSTPTMKWITNYTGGTASNPHLVKIGTNSYLLMWQYIDRVYYTGIDGNGNTVGSVYSLEGDLSDCVPVLYNGKLVWYTWEDDTVTFYNINISSLSNNSKTVLKNGHDFKTEVGSGGKAKQTCTRCGYKRTITVPISTWVWWNEDLSNGNAYSYYSDLFHPGDTIEAEVEISSSVENRDVVFKISDTSIAALDHHGYSNIRRITMKKVGSFTVSIYPRYNPSAVRVYKFTVDHSWVDHKTITPATATSEGLEERTCSECGLTEQHTIPRLSSSSSGSSSSSSTSSSSSSSSKPSSSSSSSTPGSSSSSSSTSSSSTTSSSSPTDPTPSEGVTSSEETSSDNESAPPEESTPEQVDTSGESSGGDSSNPPADSGTDSTSSGQTASDGNTSNGSDPETSKTDGTDQQSEEESENSSLPFIIIGASAAVLLAGGGITLAVIKKKKKQ